MESPTGSAPAIAAETRVRGVTFHDFGDTLGLGLRLGSGFGLGLALS